jgi:hypothetical protein
MALNVKTLPTKPLLGLLVLAAGCQPDSTQLSSGEAKAFATAPVEVAQTWQKALAADKANDYVTAQRLLGSLQQLQLSAPQQQALAKETAAFGQRVWAAAEKNDPVAAQAIQASKTSSSRRTR